MSLNTHSRKAQEREGYYSPVLLMTSQHEKQEAGLDMSGPASFYALVFLLSMVKQQNKIYIRADCHYVSIFVPTATVAVGHFFLC